MKRLENIFAWIHQLWQVCIFGVLVFLAFCVITFEPICSWQKMAPTNFKMAIYQLQFFLTGECIKRYVPILHDLWKKEKCSSLASPRGMFHKTQWAWQGVKLTQLMWIFTSNKVWKFLIKIQLTKSYPKSTSR
jgi:hypothetical protein